MTAVRPAGTRITASQLWRIPGESWVGIQLRFSIAWPWLKPGAAAFTLPELQAFLKERLGKHEMVQALDIRDDLPKTPVGKLSKKELYEEEEKKRAAKV